MYLEAFVGQSERSPSIVMLPSGYAYATLPLWATAACAMSKQMKTKDSILVNGFDMIFEIIGGTMQVQDWLLNSERNNKSQLAKKITADIIAARNVLPDPV